MERYVCIHGHFYQPPRENPWLEAIEVQDSAYPYHDWNERVTAECYAPNTAARMLDGEGRIRRIVNNYSKISFNFGPTLLSWLAEKQPPTYQAILNADIESQKNFGGHGSAIAQAYSHMILPLANRRDKQTQILWGIRDFEHRFARKPEGLWLPETAVDFETLDLLAAQEIRFTILAPSQARRVRPIGSRLWRDVSGARIDPSMAYRIRLTAGRTVSLFFYDGPVSHAVAFEHLLAKGEDLAGRILGAFSDSRTWPQLVHIATDGETYGHHFAHGDMALASALDEIASKPEIRLTDYGEYLNNHSPTHEVGIFPNSSWSCVHGVERWRSNCGCQSGGHPEWSQEWRGPLREAFDWLRDSLAPHFEQEGARLFRNPWAARNHYVDVILDRSPDGVERFFQTHARRVLSEMEKIRALQLMELQRHAMLMYTSCGWFFDDISGLETVQVIQYAGRVLQLAADLFGEHYEGPFLERLQKARSNVPEHSNGRVIYEKFVKPAAVDIEKAGAHYAVSSLFDGYGEKARVYCFNIERADYKSLEAGKMRLALGRARVASEITRESGEITFGIVHLGDHNVTGSVRRFHGEEPYRALVSEISEAFSSGDVHEVIRLIDRHFGAGVYSLRLLFRDEQRRILRLILDSTLSEAEALYRSFYERHAPLLHFVTELGIPLPRRFKAAAELVLNLDLQRAFRARHLDFERIHRLVSEGRTLGLALDQAGNEFVLRQTLERLAVEFEDEPVNLDRLVVLQNAVQVVTSLPFEVNVWKTQNICYGILQSVYPRFRSELASDDGSMQNWLEHFEALGRNLGLLIPAPGSEANG
jgi:alpha-amylase/alpha-mannosidase (GH57 family)